MRSLLGELVLKCICSGGQTGADQAGLEAAMLLGLRPSGLTPKGFRTDDGPMPEALRLRWNVDEHWSASYPPRTEENVFRSQGTVVFGKTTSRGCALTITLCRKHGRPCLTNPTAEALLRWTIEHQIKTLNVAGNRERTNPGIFDRTLAVLLEAFK